MRAIELVASEGMPMLPPTVPPSHDLLADRIRARLAEIRKSGREVSIDAGLGITFVSDILKGKSLNPSRSRLEKLAEAMSVSVEYLLGDEPAAPTASYWPVPLPSGPSATYPLFMPTWPDADGFFDMAEGDESIADTIDVGPEGFAVMVPDDANAPRYRAGEIVFANPRRPVAAGAFVVIRCGDRGTIREVVSVSADGVEVRALSVPNEKYVILRSTITKIARITASREN